MFKAVNLVRFFFGCTNITFTMSKLLLKFSDDTVLRALEAVNFKEEFVKGAVQACRNLLLYLGVRPSKAYLSQVNFMWKFNKGNVVQNLESFKNRCLEVNINNFVFYYDL